MNFGDHLEDIDIIIIINIILQCVQKLFNIVNILEIILGNLVTTDIGQKQLGFLALPSETV